MKEKKILTSDAAAELVKSGDVVMVGGFMGCGSPPEILSSLEKAGTNNLTLVCNDAGWYMPDKGMVNGVAPLVLNKQFSKAITTHIGLNSEMQRQMLSGETDVQLVPQGTLAEKIRSAGCGLGGFLTPTGVGTEVEEGKEVIEHDGKKYLLEYPLKGNVALLHASVADKAGNLLFARSARNFGPLMAMACDLVIVQADKIVEIGELDPEAIITPSIFVDYLVQTVNAEGK
ncbi:MAG: 3-oxoacid CoA-transferase subunit A [Spirochaetales bacterium]|nr:3-oxoacid CoA-transferase subunit A [Spirochaetales bacterium]